METVGDYEFSTSDLIGHGAFAIVYKGRHKKNHDQVVAIKSVAKKNLGKSNMFLGKEINILEEITKLHHKNVVALLQCVNTTQKLYIVIEYCNGGDLAEYLQARGALKEDTIRLFLRQIAEAVKALHAKGVVHRDLKPHNILLCHSGRENPPPSEITLKIADFGFARFLHDGVMAATLCGSPMYMAPEVIMSLKYDAKADLWSIGTIVFQCLTGRAPFSAPNPPALKQMYENNANLAPDIPGGTSPELTELLIGLMKRDAKDRMEFDQFFNHPFLKIERPQSSSPVPVPFRRSLSPDHFSPTYLPQSSSQCWEGEVGGEDMAPSTSPLSTSPMQSSNSKPFQSETPRDSSPIEQDFVVIPRNIAEDVENFELNHNNSPKKQQQASPCKIPVCNSAYRKSGCNANINLSSKTVSYQPMAVSSQASSATAPSSGSGAYAAAPISTSPYSYQCSEPVPVPNHSDDGSKPSPGGHSPGKNLDERLVTPSCPKEPVHSDPVSMQKNSHNSNKGDACCVTDVSSFTPPAVQFSIGTPPPGARLRSYSSGTPPPGSGRQTPTSWRCGVTPTCTSVSNSPLKRSGNTPPISSCVPMSGNSSSLSPVMGSPSSKDYYRGDHHRCSVDPPSAAMRPMDYRNVNNAHCPIRVAFGGRTMTLPEFNTKDLWPSGAIHESDNQESFLQRSGSSGKLCEQHCMMGHFTLSGGMSPSPPGAAMLPYNQQLPHHPYHHHHAHHPHPYSQPTCQIACWSCGKCSPGRMRRFSGGPMYMDTSPTNVFMCGNSPSSLEEPHFIAPPLNEETLLEKEHNVTLAKLNYISALVKCILDFAKNRSSPAQAVMTDSISRKESTDRGMGEGYQRAVQLLLYMKALTLLSSSLQLSQREVKEGHLHPSSSVKSVLHSMKEEYHYCLKKCKSLNTPGLLQSVGLDPSASNITADKILYNYAIETCQSAALEELFGEVKESFHRYQTAQILLHSLSQQVSDMKDKELLHKYRNAVEKRLTVLSSTVHAYAYDTP